MKYEFIFENYLKTCNLKYDVNATIVKYAAILFFKKNINYSRIANFM